MGVFLDLVYVVVALVTAPWWLRKSRGGWRERFGRIEPLPQIRPAPLFAYEPAGRRSPFMPDQPQQRRFPGSGGTEEGKELAGPYLHVDAGKNPRRPEREMQILDTDPGGFMLHDALLLRAAPSLSCTRDHGPIALALDDAVGQVGAERDDHERHHDLDQHQKHIVDLKQRMMQRLRDEIPGVEFNGDVSENSLYTVLNVRFPDDGRAEMLLYNLDIEGIACSGGSACSSGSNQGSHVLRALNVGQNSPSIRFSFSRYTTREEIDYAVGRLAHHLAPATVQL